MSVLTKDWPGGYVDSDGDKHAIRYWGEHLLITADLDDGQEYAWTVEGRGAEASFTYLTLRNAPAPKRSGWVNWLALSNDHATVASTFHDTRELADRYAAGLGASWTRIACIQITEGDGLTTPASAKATDASRAE
jgi:hypothetical protein